MRSPESCKAMERRQALQRLTVSGVMPMRYVFPVAILSGLLIVVPSAFAQRGSFGGGHAGGHFGGGSAGHFGGGAVSHFSGPAFSGPGRMPGFPTHSFGSAPRMAFGSTAPNRTFAPGSGFAGSGFMDRGDRNPGGRDGGDRDHDGHYRSPYRGYGYGGYGGYPYYANSWELLPWDLGYSDFAGNGYYDDDDSGSYVAQQPSNQAVTPPDQGYAPEGYPQQDEGYSPDYGPQPYPDYAPPPPSDAAIAPEPPLTLIFKDGHQESIQNFVLTPNTVIVMEASGRQQRIPLANLNLPATEQAAQQAGLDFAPPA